MALIRAERADTIEPFSLGDPLEARGSGGSVGPFWADIDEQQAKPTKKTEHKAAEVGGIIEAATNRKLASFPGRT